MSASNYWHNIPFEFRSGRWAVASMTPGPDGKLDKSPRHPADGRSLSVNRPESWASFDQCVGCGAPAVGRLVRASERHVWLDLDDPAGIAKISDETRAAIAAAQSQLIADLPPTYAERSVSGRGLHVCLGGYYPGGFHKPGLELYGDQRFLLMTGDCWPEPRPVIQAQAAIDRLVAVLSTGGARHTDLDEDELDDSMSGFDLFRRMERAANRGKFLSYMEDGYAAPEAPGDRSEADMSLMQMLCFYLPTAEAVLELWEDSPFWRVRPDGSVDKPGYGRNVDMYRGYLLRTWKEATRRALTNRQAERQRNKDTVNLSKLTVNGRPVMGTE